MTAHTVARPKLAYLSPMPPERSGISDYSYELLPKLSQYYNIDVIVPEDTKFYHETNDNYQYCNLEWFKANHNQYDRILYHFGNSNLHRHMFSLLDNVPGVVVLHDFFLVEVITGLDISGVMPNALNDALYHSHGYIAPPGVAALVLQEQDNATNSLNNIWKYPCNLGVLQKSLGVIVHSENSRRLAVEWYGKKADDNWAVIPILREPKIRTDRAKARQLLNLNDNDFVVCSFGFLGAAKLNHRLLNAWLASILSKNANCVLVFVGENAHGEYGKDFINTIRQSGIDIRITGWVDTSTFHHYLSAADIGVQLRTLSRGETSAAVLDCMNYGLPTIVNANGSMAELADDTVWKLPDEFKDADLITAMEILYQNASKRQQLGTKAQEIISTRHSPENCVNQYVQAIETMYQKN